MIVTKYGHCCLLIEENGVRILTDPGSFSTQQNYAYDVDVVLITHEHQDHFHIESLKAVLDNNPDARIITNKSVGRLLDKENIRYDVIEDKQSMKVKDILIEGFGREHAVIHSSFPSVENTGYFINNRLFYPGDAFTDPHKSIEILALPVAGPWMKISEALDYALELGPKICFPVHDGVLVDGMRGFAGMIAKSVFAPKGIEYVQLNDNNAKDFGNEKTDTETTGKLRKFRKSEAFA